MLFSRTDVANFINAAFEPAWQTVRPVPTVQIDFGNGTVVTRTLHGNIATHVCTAEGQVLDVLPGIYTPPVYLAQLNQLRLLARFADQEGPGRRAAQLVKYHQTQAENLAKVAAPAVLVDPGAMSKRAIERAVKLVLHPPDPQAPPAKLQAAAPGTDLPPADLATWKLLADDAQANETIRRRQIHERLAAVGTVTPAGLTKWLYKEVLHADLDDPYLGLAGVLFPNYPFANEDRP